MGESGRKPPGRRPKVSGRGTSSPKGIETTKRHAEWLQRRIEGWSYRRIAEHYGVQDSTVWEAVTKELKAIRREPAEELRQLELEALDALIDQALTAVEAGDLERIEQVRKLRADRRKMLGLDAPQKLEVSAPREELWARVRAWLASPTPELEAVLKELGWRRQ